MQPLEPSLLKAAVIAICPDIATRARTLSRETDESRLWKVLSTCLLSSQVPYSLALVAADAIERAGLLTNPMAYDVDANAKEVERVLSRPLQVDGRLRSYRFPVSKSVQLARTCDVIHRQHHGLGSLLAKFDNEQSIREWFIAHAPGIGPKQASMFLRNIGFTYQLAVLDRHVVNYMVAMRLETPKDFSNIQRYYSCEKSLQQHADAIGYPVGLLDWAIWIVMRAARGLKVSAG